MENVKLTSKSHFYYTFSSIYRWVQQMSNSSFYAEFNAPSNGTNAILIALLVTEINEKMWRDVS